MTTLSWTLTCDLATVLTSSLCLLSSQPKVQSVLQRHWNQQRMQFAGTFANADFFRSASYVASSLTEVHRCYSIESHTEHMNGKSYSDIFRSESPFVWRWYLTFWCLRPGSVVFHRLYASLEFIFFVFKLKKLYFSIFFSWILSKKEGQRQCYFIIYYTYEFWERLQTDKDHPWINQPHCMALTNGMNPVASCGLNWKIKKKDAVLLRSCKGRSRYFLPGQHLEDIISF